MTDDRIMEIAASLAGFAPEELRPERERLVAFARTIRRVALEEAIVIIESHKVPVGNSAAGEMAAGWTMDALHEIRDEIRALATETNNG